MKTRAQAALVVHQVVEQGQSLSTLLPAAQDRVLPRDRALLQELCFGTLRWLSRLEAMAKPLMERPLKGKQRPVHFLLLVGLYQLLYTRVPAHAALSETVNACRLLKAESLRGLLNGVLRNVQRQAEALATQADANDSTRFACPNWMIQRLRTAYPAQYQQILTATNQRPPMWLRVNRRHQSRDAYMARLQEAGIEVAAQDQAGDGLCLAQPWDVTRLPGFADGDCSVQDGAAQLAAHLLGARDGERLRIV